MLDNSDWKKCHFKWMTNANIFAGRGVIWEGTWKCVITYGKRFPVWKKTGCCVWMETDSFFKEQQLKVEWAKELMEGSNGWTTSCRPWSRSCWPYESLDLNLNLINSIRRFWTRKWLDLTYLQEKRIIYECVSSKI